MRQRGSKAGALPRIVTALAVAVVTTVASVRLFLNGNSNGPAIAVSAPAGSVLDRFAERAETATPAPSPVIVRLTLGRTDSVADYLRDAGLSREDASLWARHFREAARSGIMRRGHSLTLYMDPETGGLRGLKYDLDRRVAVSEQSLGEHVIRSSLDLLRYVTRPVSLAFEIKGDFRRVARRHDLPGSIIAKLGDAFGTRHSLNRLPAGSAIKLIYREKVSRDGSYRLVEGLEAAQLKIGDKTLSAFSFRDEHGSPHLYDAKGESVSPQILRFPLRFQYISSRFSYHRYNPILHYYRPHVGVDLAARYGTPVKAIANGRVVVAGWCGELGRCVRIEHANGMASVYGHLSRITNGIRPGVDVHLGQRIGRVGSSGLSTGPHLHFAIEKDGRYVNPLTQKLGIHHKISPRMRALFDRIKARYLAMLAKLPDFDGHFSVPRGESGSAAESEAVFRAHLRTRHASRHWRARAWRTAAAAHGR
jgi:murein DD-endopeptidase MepM/ murein hydrolase activator NlpD